MPTLRTIQSTGNSANRVDIVFLGDGYTSGEIATAYTAHVQSYVDYLFGGTALTDPFNRYQSFFNIFAIDVISNELGADDLGRGIVRDTALNARYYWDGVTERLLYIDDAPANAIVSATLAGTGIDAEMRYVTVNETKYGGGGGFYGVFAGGNTFAHEVALHEIGHSFAGLADEYGGDTGTYPGGEPFEINVTTNPLGTKWAEWLGYVDPTLGVVGAYEGGQYYDHGVYRPTQDSKMRSLERPFDPIAREEFIHRFYSFVDPLDGFDSNVGTRTNLQALHVDTIDPAIVLVDWTVNGQTVINAGESFSLRDHNYGYGTYTVVAHAYDPTPWVRGDRGDLEQNVTWTVVNDYRLVGTIGNDALTGNANAQEIVGLDGDDTLNGGAGDDTLDGGLGTDTADYSASGAQVIVNLESAAVGLPGNTATGASIGTDTLFVVENAIGGTGDDYLFGTSAANVLSGGEGNDAIYGFGGNDVIDTGNGAANYVEASGGNDNVTGGTGIDIVYGGASNDTLTGGDGNDTLSGDGGIDSLYGGAGIDLLYVDSTDAAVSGGTDADYLAVNDAAVGVNISGTDIENWFGYNNGDTFNSTGASTLIYMRGAGGADTLTGGSSGDWLYGDDGNDTIVGGVGNDVLVGGNGADQLNGGNDTDLLYVDRFDTSYLGGAGIDYLVVQDLSDAAYGIGSTGIEYAYGYTANDMISAAGAAVQVELHGGDGNDTLTGGSGVNILLGENGADTLVAGSAATDHFVGGDGTDTISVASNGGTDYFYDFQNGSDHINLHNTGLTAFGQLTIDSTYSASNWYGVGYGTGTLWVQTGSVGTLDAPDFVF